MATTVTQAVGVLRKIRSADIAVHPQRCVAVRNRNAGCRRCAEACVSGALSVEENELVVDSSRCIGCGTCATMCPTCALEARRPNDLKLLASALGAARANDGVAVLGCRQVVEEAAGYLDGEKVVGVECLGRVDESLLVTLASCGVQRVVLVEGHCEQCDHAAYLETAKQVVQSASDLLKAWGSSAKVRVRQKFPRSVAAPEEAYDQGKRNFFFRIGEGASQAAVAAVAAQTTPEEEAPETDFKLMRVMEDGALPHFVPDRRERLLDALAKLGEPCVEVIESRLWGHVVIDTEACVSCQMCATFCPTAALTKFDEAGEVGVYHFPGDCVRCRCCEDICPADALRVDGEVPAACVLDGTSERIVMHGRDPRYSGPKKAEFTMRQVLGCEEVYDR